MPPDILVKEEFTSSENNDIINKDKVGEFVVDHSLYTENSSTIPSNNTVNTMNTNNISSQSSIPNIYASAPSTPSSINIANINSNQNIS